MDTQVKSFYKNKTIFLTGGSGFVGKITIEKLLRTTEVKRIYVLIRPKKGICIEDRLASWNTEPPFELLRTLDPNFMDRISPIAGDCELPDLGISAADRKLLIDEVQVLLHCAATVSFIQKFSVALSINTRGTLLMLQLAKEMRQLESYVHVSTTYATLATHVDEHYHPEFLTSTYDKVLEMQKILDVDLLNNMALSLFGKFPNVYTYTKALAEQVMEQEAKDMPACVFRPPLILCTYKEPLRGWTDNMFGPISIVQGVTYGVLRVMYVETENLANIVPVDYSVNMLLSCAWLTAVDFAERKQRSLPPVPPPIYNFVPSNENALTWNGFIDEIEKKRYLCPLETMIWYPCVVTSTKYWFYRFLILFLHIIPGFLMDMGLRLKGKKPRLLKIYGKIHRNIERVSPFSLVNITFETKNTKRLLERMTSEDRKLFEFDMKYINWDDFFKYALLGMREFIGKEKPTKESVKKGRKLMKRFEISHRLVQTIVFGLLAFLFYRLLKTLISAFF